MAEVERIIDAPPDRVWAVLADGWNYSNWVVGTSHIRDVDQTWPQPGSRLHHTSGLWPLVVRDITLVRRAEPPNLLIVKPRLWPFGRGVVTVRLRPVNAGRTKVTLGEDFDRGPLRWLLIRVNDMLLHRRNEESLRRLENLAIHRPR
jgi:uncharacterized protein YndB with AHSA1/START domain